MTEPTFVNYIQEPDVHDGIVVSATYRKGILRSILNKREVNVLVLTYEQRLFIITFGRVHSAIINNVEGMMLYSLTEMSAESPFRRFVFVNWYDGEESHRELEVVAREISSVELTEDFIPKEAIEELRNKFSFQGSKFTR